MSTLKHLVTLANIGTSHTNRCHEWLFFERKDDNIFVPASVVYILKDLKPFLTPNEQIDVDYISKIVKHRYPLYKNITGRLSYNFWRTNHPNSHFPNGKILNKFKFFRLPDDIDTTAMVLLSGGYEYQDVTELNNILPKHANGVRLKVKTSLPQFENLSCYSTWLGEQMPIELDCCVISNFLLLVFESQVAISVHDRDSVAFLEGVIESGYYFTHPSVVAPQYPRTAVILYHLARLVSKFPNNFNLQLIEKLKSDVNDCYLNSSSLFEKMILQSSLLKLGLNSHFETIIVPVNEIESYWWFTAGFLSGYSNKFAKNVAHLPLFHNRFVSSFLNYALLFENQTLLAKANEK